jgi:hypothetical protein
MVTRYALAVLLSTLSVHAAGEGRLLFQDRFETLATRDGVSFSVPELAGKPGKDDECGRITGPVSLVEGVSGKGARLAGLAQIRYDRVDGWLDLTGGEIAFSVRLHFDPLGDEARVKTVLRNQMFFTLWDFSHTYTQVSLYNAGRDQFAVAVWNAERNLVFHRAFQQAWKPGEWHRLALRWGREMELWCDGERRASGPFDGLFGPLPVDLKATRAIVGSHIGWNDAESEFSLDELTVRGPGEGQIAPRPRLSVPQVTGAPTVDGDLGDPFWRQAARVSGFTCFDRDELAALQPVVTCAATELGLCVAVDAPLPEGAVARALLTERDAAIYTEDTVEIFLQPAGAAEGSFFQFMVSARGTRFDARHDGSTADVGGYAPEWQAAAALRPGGWCAEAIIPYAALGVAGPPQAGDVWRANFCQDSSAGFSSAVTWSFTSGNFTRPMYFGELVFTGRERALRQEQFTGFGEGEPALTFSLVGDFQPIITVTGELFDAAGSSIYRNEMRLRDSKSVDIRPPFLTTGAYALLLDARDETGQQVFFQNLKFRTAKAFDLAASNYPQAGYARFAVNARGVKDPLSRVVVRVAAEDGKPAGEVVIAELKAGVGEARFPNRDLAPGAYTVEAQALGTEGTVLESARQNLRLFPLPAWWSNDLGLDHSVPPPFTPVEVRGEALCVWGRELDFGQAAFPRQLRNQGRELFLRPPEFRCQVDDQTLDLAAIEGKFTESFPDAVTRTGSAGLPGGGAITVRTTVEFDGFAKTVVTISPKTAMTVAELSLTLALPRDLTQFWMTSNGATSNIVSVQERCASAFIPYVWIGNDTMGLCWTAETDQFWQPKPEQALELMPSETETRFRVSLIAVPRTLTEPVTFAFALMATPVRPIPRNNPFACPSYHAKGNVTFSEFLTYRIPPGLSREQGTLEFWLQRSAGKAPGNTAVFSIGPPNQGITALLLTPDQPDSIGLYSAKQGEPPLLAGKAPATTDSFHHVALTWDGNGLRLHIDGHPVAAGDTNAADRLRALFSAEKALIRFGCNNEYYGYTGITVDEVRISRVARYGAGPVAPPTAPFDTDAQTLLLDSLDDRFRPDGQDAETAGGGVPSLGARFVDGRFGGGLLLQVGPARPALEVLKDYGIPVYSHWEWQREMPVFYGQPVLHDDSRVVPTLAAELAEGRRLGVKSIPYLAYPAISSTSGLIEQFGDEWRILPVSTTPWQFPGAPENYHFLNCCVNARGYADYFASGVVWAMDTLGFDGFYSDGLTNVAACQNEAHGCGYRDAEGRLHATWPMFSVRETVKRMVRLVKQRDPEGWVVNHASFNLLAPILSFSDVVYTGEHEDYENLLTARLRFSSEPWGLYVTLLGSSEHVYSPLHAMTPLLCGTSVWGTGMVARNDQGRKDAAIRAVYRTFDTSTATWLPWWRAELGACRPDDPKTKVSLYAHPGRGLLLLAANYNAGPRDARIRLALGEFGLEGRVLRAVNTLTDQPLRISADGVLEARIQGKSFVLARVE